jgi:polar amino acid transport system substrate-binding protein
MSTLYATPAREQVVNFLAYEKVVDGTIIDKGNPDHIKSLASLCGLTDAQEVGSAEVEVAQAQSSKCTAEGKAPITVLSYSDQDEVFLAIEEGRANITMTDTPVVQKVVEVFPDTLQTGFNTDLPYTIAIAAQKKETTLLNGLYSALRAVQSEGIEKKLLTKWSLATSSLVPAKIYR